MVSWPSDRMGVTLPQTNQHETQLMGLSDKELEGYLLKGNDSVPTSDRPTDSAFSYINVGEEDQMEIYGYRRSVMKTTATYFFILITVGILRLVYHWFPEWFLNCTHSKCSLESAEKVLVVELFQKKHRRLFILPIKIWNSVESMVNTKHTPKSNESTSLCLPESDGTFRDVSFIRMFTCKTKHYVWNEDTKQFQKLLNWGIGMPTSSLHCADGLCGLSINEQRRRRAIYGSNYIHVPVTSILELLVLEVMNPFYVFQVFSIIVWSVINYYYFAGVIAFMLVASAISTIYQTRKNQTKLRKTVQGSDIIEVCRGDGTVDTVRTEDLVPGDVIIIPPNGCTLYCDAILLFGTCIVNESMLTGESVPVTKTPLPHRNDIMYHSKEHSRHTLFCGTKVVQTRFYDDEKVMAVVISTGYMTAKGSLVSAIMYPPPVDFRFERDSYRFVGFLASLASIGFIYSIIQKIIDGETGAQVIFHSFDIITICVPPALPAAMTAGIILAQKRLELRNIFCISPRSINVSGSLNCVCFDKTGTLTEDGLDLWGVVPVVEQGRCLPPIKNPSKMPQAMAAVRPVSNASSSLASKLEPPLLLMGMATCHSLTIIDGVLSGDPLDLKMFESTQWKLVEPSNEDTNKYDNICPTIVTWTPEKSGKSEVHAEPMGSTLELAESTQVEVGIIRQFPFSSALQRMAVLCKRIGEEQMHFFCKGSPEMIQSLSKPETVPPNFSQVLEEYTRQGYRVIALAHRPVEFRSILKLQKVQREELEHDLTFLGLVVLENRLKADTTAIIGQLMEADIRTIMVTGDNLLTAVSVARDCGMVGAKDQVVIVSYDESVNSAVWSQDTKPQLIYTLAEHSVLQSPTNGASPPNQLSEEIAIDMLSSESQSRTHLAVMGKCWAVIRNHYPELVKRIAVKSTIFARMSPDQKQQLVQELQKLGYVVGMCGDGANDCGALKAAHAGIALTDSEASVASPFTSKDSSISCVPELIRQGRAALVTSFGIFKYMAAYSLCQFISVMLLYESSTNLTDFQFLYIDLFLICSLSAVFGYTDPHPGPLHKRPPLMSLLSPSPIGSLLIQTLLIGLFQGLSVIILRQQDWFVPYMELHNVTGLETGLYACHENYSVFSVSMLQYVVLALAYAKGRPYRKPFYTNFWLVGALVASTGFSLYAMIEPDPAIRDWLELEMPPFDFRMVILGLSAAEVVLCLLAEEILVDRALVRMTFSDWWLRLRPRKEKYLAIEKELAESNWPDDATTNCHLSSSPPDSTAPSHTASPPIVAQTKY